MSCADLRTTLTFLPVDGQSVLALRSVVTPQAFRGKGFGAQLLRAAELIAAKASLSAVCVSSIDGKGDQGAAGFYKHMGFTSCSAYEDERLPMRAMFEAQAASAAPTEYFIKYTGVGRTPAK